MLPETRWQLDFGTSIVRNDTETSVKWARRCGQDLPLAGLPVKISLVTTKLWNTNHRPERVEPAFGASLDRPGVNYLDLYLVHTPFAFQPGDDQDPRDQNGMSFTTAA